MEYEIEKRFRSDFTSLKNKELAIAISDVIKNVSDAKDPKEILNLKKLKGYKTEYRIRTGQYRIGISIINNTIIFKAFAHRKEIYRRFP